MPKEKVNFTVETRKHVKGYLDEIESGNLTAVSELSELVQFNVIEGDDHGRETVEIIREEVISRQQESDSSK